MKYGKVNLLLIFTSGIFFRLLFLISPPLLSDDVYRFIWDAKILVSGENPYAEKPSEIGANDQNTFHLLKKMNSPDYYSVYPPLQQLLFLPLGGTNMIGVSGLILHFIIFIGELLFFLFLRKSIEANLISIAMAGWLWLNPLWIIEINGNLHFEGWMITLFLIGIYYLHIQKKYLAALFMGLSASLKLVPAIVVPAVKKAVGWNKAILIFIVSGIVFLILFSPVFLSGNLDHFRESTDLYFHKFEFNASFYFLLRAFGFMISDTHPIVYAFPVLMGVFAVLYSIIVFSKDEMTMPHFLSSCFFILAFYFLLSTTVHPWYILSVLFFSVLANFKTGIVWSFLVFLSYAAYSDNEKLYYIMVITEYFILFGCMIWEFRDKFIFRQGSATD